MLVATLAMAWGGAGRHFYQPTKPPQSDEERAAKIERAKAKRNIRMARNRARQPAGGDDGT